MVSRLALVFSVSLGGLLGTTMLSWWRGSELLKPVTELLAASEVEAAEPEPDDTESLRLVLSLPVSGSQRQAGTTELKRAQTLARSGNAQGAQGGYERSAELFPQFADWAHMLAAGTAAGRGDTASVADLLGRIGPQMALEWGWRHRVTALRNAGDTTAALMVAERLAGELEGARRADAWRMVGELRLARWDTAAATMAFRNAMETAPLASSAVDAARALSALPNVAPADQLAIGRLYLRHGNVDRGIGGLNAFVTSGGGEPDTRAEALLEIGRAHFRARRYQQAERVLAPLVTQSQRAVAAEAMFLVGRSQFRLNRTTEAKATFQRVADRFPGEVAAADALFVLADLDHDDGRLDSARRHYTRILEWQPEAGAAARSAMRSGGLLYLDGDYAAAAGVFDRYRESHRSGRDWEQATYWSARAQVKLGNGLLAAQRLNELIGSNPTSYYAMRASDLLGGASWQASLAPSPGTSVGTMAEATTALVRLDVLKDLGLTEAAAYEMERLHRYFQTQPGALYVLAEALVERGEIFAAIRLGRELQRREGAWNERLLRIVYPFPYRTAIVTESRKHGLDPYLVAGLIRQESMFNAVAVSPAGAIGLMQIMPATGRRLGPKAGMRTVTAAELKRPEVSIRLGTIFLADLLRSYGGKVPDALAAYNAGPSRLIRWRNFPEYGDDDLFAERIPFDETRDYVKIVQQNARIYQALYGPGTGTD